MTRHQPTDDDGRRLSPGLTTKLTAGLTGPVVVAVAAVALALSACSSDDDSSSTDTAAPASAAEAGDEADATDDASAGDDSSSDESEGSGGDSEAADGEGTTEEELLEEAEDFADDIAEDVQEVQDAVGGGGATLVVGDQEWTFDAVLCAFGEEEIGQEGAEFVLSSIQDGLQLYASIDSFGHSVSLDDIEDFANPSVSLFSLGDEIITVDGTSITVDAEFVDGTTDSAAGTPGTLTATCP